MSSQLANLLRIGKIKSELHNARELAEFNPQLKAAAPAKRARGKNVTASELLVRGVARHMIQSWIVSGVLLRTDQRGVYRTTALIEKRIVAYAARGAN